MSGRHTLEELLTLDDEPGPARRVSAAETDAMVEGVLDRWAAPPPGGSGGGAAAAGGKGAGGWMLGGAIAVVAVGGALLAVLGSPDETPAPAEVDPASSSAATAADDEGASRGAAAGSAEQAAVQPSEPEPQPHAVAAPEPSESPDDSLDDNPAEPAGDRAPRRRAARADIAPEDLLDRGNRLRREGRWGEAEQAYLAAMERSPGSLTAQVAGVAAGAIRLDHRGDARGAMALFRRALRAQPRGPLALEAREGLARAARGAGDAATERATLRAILDHHPGTPAADRARSRLGSLGADVAR